MNQAVQKKQNNRLNRRGVTLLLVVSIIVLFLLMGTTFVVLTNDYVSESRNRMVRKMQDLEPREVLNRGFYDYLRGVALDNTHSPLRGHSILGDMYGYGVTAFIDSISRHPASANGNLYEVQIRDGADDATATDHSATQMRTGAVVTLDTLCGGNQFYFNGCVFSIVSGPARGRSFRILEHRFDDNGGTNEHTFVILEDFSDGGTVFDIGSTATPQVFEAGLLGSRVVINGRAFSGTGATAATQANYRRFDDSGTNAASNFTNYIAADNSPNEPWDAVEHQAIDNIWLSDYKYNTTENKIERASFHRPELTGGTVNTRSFRPVVSAGANATARTGEFPSAAAPHTATFATEDLDFDNLGDGFEDSIWMDLNYPTTMLSDGRLVKPLFAPLIIDLDRNVNINAAGVDTGAGQTVGLLGTLTTQPRGFGFGPAEFELDDVLGTSSSSLIAARYGADGFPGVAGRETWSHVSMAGWPDSGALWNNDNISLNQGGVFGSTVDLYNRFTVGYLNALDANNVPLGLPGLNIDSSEWDPNGDATYDESDIQDSPYELNLLHTSAQANDALFTAREMEGYLRQLDPDAITYLQQNRLQTTVAADLTMNRDNVNKITTHSFEVPRTPLTPGGDTIVEALQAKMTSGGTTSERRELILTLLAPEVVMGLPMDINRPFGDGVDNGSNGIVDEHSVTGTGNNESGTDQVVTNTTGYNELTPTTLTRAAMDHNNDGTANGAGDHYARQIFARHLMMLTWVVLDTGTYPDFDRDGTGTVDDVHQLAQWCVNVVDFRDPDSIMTGFEYDLNPFDGWDVDGDLTTDESTNTPPVQRFVVFGAERPELLINETFAAHIRRMDDLDTDPTGADTASGDDDFDNELLPEPVCFVELLAPQFRPILTTSSTDKTQANPLGLYNSAGNLPLGARTSGNSPVWRMAFTEQIGADPLSGRRVYFNQPSAVVEDGTNPNFYYPEASIVSSYRALAPGGRAVVGSSGININGTSFRTTFGRRTDATVDRTTPANTDLRLDVTRGITLIPGTGVSFNDGSDPQNLVTNNAVAIPINRWGPTGLDRSFGLSDPDEGYETLLGVTTQEYDPDGNSGQWGW